MNYLLRNDDGATMLVDRDLWLGALDLAVRNGWKPRGVQVPRTGRSAALANGDRLSYADSWGQRITREDAGDLARGLRAGLATVPDSVVPLQGKAFGSQNTRQLIERASAGEDIALEDLPGAAEVLSGPPKVDALELAGFLARGACTVLPT